MVVIRNKLDQRIIINLNESKSIFLLSKGTADVSDEDFSSKHLQKLIANGAIIKSHHDMKPDVKDQLEINEPIQTDDQVQTDEKEQTGDQEQTDEQTEF